MNKVFSPKAKRAFSRISPKPKVRFYRGRWSLSCEAGIPTSLAQSTKPSSSLDPSPARRKLVVKNLKAMDPNAVLQGLKDHFEDNKISSPQKNALEEAIKMIGALSQANEQAKVILVKNNELKSKLQDYQAHIKSVNVKNNELTTTNQQLENNVKQLDDQFKQQEVESLKKDSELNMKDRQLKIRDLKIQELEETVERLEHELTRDSDQRRDKDTGRTPVSNSSHQENSEGQDNVFHSKPNTANIRYLRQTVGPYKLDMRFRNWIEEFAAIASITVDDEEEMSTLLVACMSGEALRMIRTSHDLNDLGHKDFNEVTEALGRVFVSSHDGQSAATIARTLTQGDMTVAEYVKRKMEALQDWQPTMTDEVRATFVSEGLRSDIGNEVIRMTADGLLSVERVKSIATQQESFIKKRSGQNVNFKNQKSSQVSVNKDKVTGDRGKSFKPRFLFPTSSNKDTKKEPCKVCGKDNHASKDCFSLDRFLSKANNKNKNKPKQKKADLKEEGGH